MGYMWTAIAWHLKARSLDVCATSSLAKLTEDADIMDIIDIMDRKGCSWARAHLTRLLYSLARTPAGHIRAATYDLGGKACDFHACWGIFVAQTCGQASLQGREGCISSSPLHNRFDTCFGRT